MKKLFPPLRETEYGVFQPAALWFELIFCATAIAFVLFAPLVPHFTKHSPSPGMALLIVLWAAFRYYQVRKWGPDGMPYVKIANGTLYFPGADLFHRLNAIPLAELERIKVYGPLKGRSYRIELTGKPAQEFQPLLVGAVAPAVLRFLLRALPGKVLVVEPPSFFARARGEES